MGRRRVPPLAPAPEKGGTISPQQPASLHLETETTKDPTMALNRTLSRTLLSLLLLLLTAGLLFLLDGCSRSGDGGEPGASETSGATAGEGGEEGLSGTAGEGEEGGEADTEDEVEARIYEVRAEIVELPDPEDPLSGLFLHHEAIDGFVNIDNEVRGMDSMTMPFPVADGLDFEGLEVGDQVRFTLLVDYEADPQFQVTSIEALPEDTELEFRRAEPPR